jgi:hypothetical protein
MRKLFLAIGIAGISCYVNAVQLSSFNPPSANHAISQKGWVKSKSGIWMGKDKIWYKLDKKDKSLLVSEDKKEWKVATNGQWTDKTGNLMSIRNNNLVWSSDGGNTWTPVPGWKWEGGDGISYEFDTNWVLWENHSK